MACPPWPCTATRRPCWPNCRRIWCKPVFAWAPVLVARQARVALGDAAAAVLGAPAVLVLIGERPGLSSPDSLGAYLTWAPRVGLADSLRNCVSNIRLEGLAHDLAAHKITWLLAMARRLGGTGVMLKDESDRVALPGARHDHRQPCRCRRPGNGGESAPC
jgi:ethanolamine ammonia-lyase small subunit